MLTRLQELEVEMMKTKRECDHLVKETKEQSEKEKQQMKDDMATVLQVCSLFLDSITFAPNMFSFYQ